MSEASSRRRNHPYSGTDNTKPNAIWPHSWPSGGTISSDFPGKHTANSIQQTGGSNGTNLYMNCDVNPQNGGIIDGRWRVEASDPLKMVENNAGFTQSEFISHPTGCTQYVYSHPCVGAMPACGSQAMVHGPCLGGRNARVVLPLEMAEEPVYVNAKQYHGILRRRQSRAKAELENKVTRVRKPYLHESRHLHAMRRARGCGGRFLNTSKRENKASDGNARDKKNKTAFCSRSPTAEEAQVASVHGSIGNGQFGQDQTLQLMVNSFLENGDTTGKTKPGSFFHGRAASGAFVQIDRQIILG